MSDLRALILLIAVVCVGSLDIRPAFAQGVERRRPRMAAAISATLLTHLSGRSRRSGR